MGFVQYRQLEKIANDRHERLLRQGFAFRSPLWFCTEKIVMFDESMAGRSTTSRTFRAEQCGDLPCCLKCVGFLRYVQLKKKNFDNYTCIHVWFLYVSFELRVSKHDCVVSFTRETLVLKFLLSEKFDDLCKLFCARLHLIDGFHF